MSKKGSIPIKCQGARAVDFSTLQEFQGTLKELSKENYAKLRKSILTNGWCAPVLGRQDYNWKHEPILYGWKEGAGHYFNGDFTQTTVIDDDIDVTKLNRKQLIDAVRDLQNRIPTTIHRINKPAVSDLHPTTKPVALVMRNIRASSRDNEIIVDICGGSGTTMIAAEKTNRVAYLMEYDPRYADTIVKRFENFTGQKGELQRDDRITLE